ncbi:helix-turn-helix domain-containing protein [Lentzea flava]|uniref:Transcriptional regulator n=1 Tax=Lentzea flava TaxID=103732 RepID=A0ABQ2UEL8_9PSEU|nr:helix-turn-helix transcriptional regulator [Lentzea flava]MCP2198552.1 Helix-turn-helix domain-containing protein [Lentzea flava]GGU26662.1 transcriptional regulator [Lentzea flava]
MSERSDPSALRWLIGHELRQARLRAGKTQAEAGQALGCSQPRINYLETGRNQQQPEEVTTLLRLYGADVAHVDRMASLAGRADHATWWAPFTDVVPDWLKTFVGLEGLAKSEFSYEPLLIYGLLQTPAYAAALLVNNLRVAAVDIERVVRLRMERQKRLTDDDEPLIFTAVIEEAALDRLVGGVEIMRDQYAHLLTLAERDNITLHLMPTSVAVHDGLDGEFILLDFPEARSIGYVEFPDGAVYVQNHDQVAAYTLAAERLCAAALSPADTIKAIKSRLAKLR